MPVGMDELRPQWVPLTLIFWALSAPERVGVFWGFGVGLVLDAATGSLLGHNAFGLSLVAYVAVQLSQRVRLFPIWQQGLFVWVLLLVERLSWLWISGVTGQPMPTLIYWAPTFVGLLLWPWLQVVLTDLARRAGVI